jgi:hypothetical protein
MVSILPINADPNSDIISIFNIYEQCGESDI